MVLRWYQGGLNVSSITSHLGGKMAISAIPSEVESSVKIDGSG
jgi:hypothetical protein